MRAEKVEGLMMVAMGRDGFVKLVSDENINPGQDLRTFFNLLDNAEPDSKIFISAEELSRDTGLHPQMVSDSIDRLVSGGYVFRIGTDSYVLNPRLAWVGSLEDRSKAIKRREAMVAKLRLVGGRE